MEIGTVEKDVIPFIGNSLNLKDISVAPMASRVNKLVAFTRTYDLLQNVSYTVWSSLIGKLVSYSMLHRGTMSQFNYVYRHMPKYMNKLRPNPFIANITV